MVEELQKSEGLMANSKKLRETKLLPFAMSHAFLIRCCWRGAERSGLYEGGDYFDNLGGSYYNEPIFKNGLGFAKPYTQFLNYRSYRSRQINPR